MQRFPDGLVAEYRDAAGMCPVPFQLRDGKYNWEVPFRGTTLCGDELEEIVEQIPPGGELRFEVPLPFRPARAGPARVMVPLSIRAWWVPTHKRAGKDV